MQPKSHVETQWKEQLDCSKYDSVIEIKVEH